MIDRVEIFEKALNSGGGHLVLQCRCGRTNYGSDQSGDWEPGEREDLKRKRAESPDRYVAQQWDSVSSREVFGSIYVHDCPCGWEERISGLLWENRDWVMRFYSRMIEAQAAEARKDQETLASMPAQPAPTDGEGKRQP